MTVEELKSKAIEMVNTAEKEERDLSAEELKTIETLKEEIRNANSANTTSDKPDDTDSDKKDEVKAEEKKDKEEDKTDDADSKEEDKEESEEDKKESEDKNNDSSEEDKKKEDRNNNLKFKTMKKEFRLLNAINDVVKGNHFDDVTNAVINEGKEEMRSAGLNADGNIMLPSEKRSLTVTDTDGQTVAVDIDNMLAPLRDNLVMVQAGAHYLSGLKNNVRIPVLGKGAAKWASEVGQASDFGATITSKELKPHRLTTTLSVSRQFLMQDSADAENVLRADIINAIAEKLQQTVLGTVTDDPTAPKGILADSGKTVATFADVCDFESEADDANVGEKRAYILSNKAKAAFRAMAKSTKNTQLVMEGGEIDGTPAYATSSVAGKKFAYGDFSALYVAQFGGLSIITDIYSRAAYDEVVLTVSGYFDAVVVRDGAIKVGQIA